MASSTSAESPGRSRARPVPPVFPKALAARLAKLGIRRRFDLVLHLPLRYEDETRITPIREAAVGVPCQIEVEVVAASVVSRARRQLVVHVCDASAEAWLRFLNFYPSQQKLMCPGARLRVFGELRGGLWGAEMVHPRVQVVQDDAPLPASLTPVYPTTAGVSQAALRRLIAEALATEPLADTLPEGERRRHGLAGFAEAVDRLHRPPPGLDAAALAAQAQPAWRRLKFDELLAQQLSLRQAYAARRARAAPALIARHQLTARLMARLPFELTAAQQRSWREIGADLACAHPMQRLLQGDVGSGKTVLAALAMLQAAENGCQAALMAPTEILAEQHLRKLTEWLQPLEVEVAWLAGGVKKAERERIVKDLASGRIRLAVGTHALIEESVAFSDLGLAVIDEQHRFGVHQRLRLRGKGLAAHQLMMSATPIPRSLAMSHYADLDVSVLDELPPGRRPVLTKLISAGRREEVIARIRAACSQGRQAYWVCPLVEESDKQTLIAALETHDRLRLELAELRVGLVHGRMKSDDKAAVMAAFGAGEIDLLVATTVIEVGVDVPRASLMVVEHAERFGLSQLHQLRGRVGRGSEESVCILLFQPPLSDSARARLKVIYESSDGFEIARRDLELRGPGEFIGSRQSGTPWLRFADLVADEDLVGLARDSATAMLAAHQQAVAAHLDRWLADRADLLLS